MKFLLALVFVIGLLSIGGNSEPHSATAGSPTEAPSSNLPWFLTHFGDQNEFRLFIGETVLSIENIINPNSSNACIQQFINNTNTDYTQQGLVIPNITNFIRGISELAKKCGMQKIIDKVIIDLQYINTNGLKNFIAKEVSSLQKNAQPIVDCFRDVILFSNNRNKQATQLGKCLSFFIVEPSF